MKFPDLLPPGDLLKQVEGIESGLRQRKRLSALALLAAAVQAVVLIANNGWFQALLNQQWRGLITAHWPSLLILSGVVLTLFVSAWSRFWLEESQEPFRYTYSIVGFKPLSDQETQDDRLSFQLSVDLSERLNDRIRRLSLLDDVEPEKKGADAKESDNGEVGRRKSHIQIRGHYVIRKKADDQWFVEVMPRVRIGPRGSPETLAHAVKFKLPAPGPVTPQNNNGPQPATLEETPPRIDARLYEQILERVYFSIATEIYKQIQEDVKRKIELLPTTYFRAVALFHEAEDYARSTTLDAYDEALELYGQAIEAFDPSLKPWPKARLRRAFRSLALVIHDIRQALVKGLVHSFPRLGKTELMCARAEIGYANMLLYRQSLAAISHQRVNPVFEARPVAARAVERLSPARLPEDLPHQKQSLFDGYVTLAFACSSLGSNHTAKEWLAESRRLDPARTENDAKFLYVCGAVSDAESAKIQLFQRAVELDPRFDVAQFSRAGQLEMLWRTRATLERNVAELVFKEYRQVTTTNPGVVGAWSNLGYMRWLLGDAELARDAFEGGREYKEIKHDTYVAELDYGLARIAAEQGDFEEAYQLYESGVSALLAQGVAHSSQGSTGEFYHYELINRVIMNRFEDYLRAVETNRGLWADEADHDRGFAAVVEELKRICSDSSPEGQKKATQALKGFASVLKRAANRLNSYENDLLKAWAEKATKSDDESPALKTGSLAIIAEELRKLAFANRTADFFDKYYDAFRQPVFAQLIEKHLPARRIRDAVYAFVLTDFGSACKRYYYRSGNGSYRDASRDAYQRATQLYDEFALPHYYLGSLSSILEVIKLEPDWPDGILTLITARTESVREARNRLEETVSNLEAAQTRLAEIDTQLSSQEDKAVSRPASDTPPSREEAPPFAEEQERPAVGVSPLGMLLPKYAVELAEESEAESIEEPEAHGASSSYPITAARLKNPPNGQLAEELANLPNDLKLAEDLKNLQTERAELDKRIPDFEDKVTSLTTEVENLEAALQKAINEHFKPLLPHKWLQIEPQIGKPLISTKLLKRADYTRELKWEKEFNALHVRAVLAWMKVNDQLKKKVGIRELAELMDKHFWPEDFDLLLTLRNLAQTDKQTKELENHNDKIRTTIEGWFNGDPFAVLDWWVRDDKSFDSTRVQFYTKVSRQPRLSGFCYKFLADQILEAVEANGDAPAQPHPPDAESLNPTTQDALAAYERAFRADDYDSQLGLDLAEKFESLNAWDKAAELYSRCSETSDCKLAPYESHLRVGRNLLAMENDAALSEFESIGKLGPQFLSYGSNWRGWIVSNVLTHITSNKSYRLLKDWLERECDESRRQNDTQAMRDAQAALLTLSSEKYRALGQESINDPQLSTISSGWPVVTPIVIEAYGSLFPSGDNWEQSHPLFQKYIPGMRERIKLETGVSVSGVRVRANNSDLPANAYLIMLNEVPLVMGYVEPQRRFCPSPPTASPDNDASLAFNPKTGVKDGVWMAEDAKQPPEKEVESWDYFEYIIHHLEAALRANLSLFLGLQEVTFLLETWTAEFPEQTQFRSDLIDEALPTLDVRIRFTQVLQNLVKEFVPITNLPAILESFQQHWPKLEDVTTVTEAVRLDIKGELPGNTGTYDFIGLSQGFEKEIQRFLVPRNKGVTFAILPEPTQGLLSAFRDAMAETNQKKLVVVTQAAAIRPFVRRLLSYEFPEITVLSADELRPDLKSRITRTVEYGTA